MTFADYFDARADRFAALYTSRPRASLLGRRALFDRMDFAVDVAMCLTAKHVLDIGCGNGIMFGPMAAARIHVTGIEPAPRMAELARNEAEGYPTFADVSEFGWEELNGRLGSARFDLAVALGIFDYEPRPAALMHAMSEISDHIVGSFPRPGIRLRVRQIRYGRKGVRVSGYDARAIHELCSRTGFEVRRLTRLGRAGFVMHAARVGAATIANPITATEPTQRESA